MTPTAPAREVIRTVDSPRDLVDKKMATGGRDAFESAPLPDPLAESGHHLDMAGLASAVRGLTDADVHGHLPAISSALARLAEDSDEFARLVAHVDGRTRGGPAREQFAGALADLASDRTELAVGLARRLIRSGAAYPAAFLAGGAWQEHPDECGGIADSLARSDSGEAVAAGIAALRVARKMHGIADAPAWIGALRTVASRPDGAAAAEAVDALVDIYPEAREAAGPLIEGLARRHAACRSRLAARIGPHSPFDDDTSRRYLTMCAEGEPDSQNAGSNNMAAAELAKRDPATAIRIITGRVFDEYPYGGMGYALQEIGRVDPGGLVEAILDKAGACRAPARDTALPFIAMEIARHADPEQTIGPLLAGLDRGGASYRPALCMIKGMVSLGRGAARGDGVLSRMLRGLVSHARARGIDAEWLAKKQPCVRLKCAAVVECLLHPPPAADAARALQNLGMLPALKRAFGYKWAETEMTKAAANGRAPHPVTVALSIPPPGKTGLYLAGNPGGAPSETPGCESGPPIGPALLEIPEPPAPPTRSESIALECLVFLDRALASLEDAGLETAGYARKMKNADQFLDTISEIAVVVAFAGKYKVALEPPAGKKRLDAAIELGPQRVLVEVLGPRMWGPLDLLAGSRGVKKDRAPRKIFDKAKEQILAPGTCNDPVVVAVDTGRSEVTLRDIENYVCGPTVYTAEVDRVTGGEITSASRDAEKCMHYLDARTDSISAVVCFEQDMSADPAEAVRGVIIVNPYAAVPLAPEARDAFERVLQGSQPGGGSCGGGAR